MSLYYCYSLTTIIMFWDNVFKSHVLNLYSFSLNVNFMMEKLDFRNTLQCFRKQYKVQFKAVKDVPV